MLRSRRVCRSGAGYEETNGECDTPGFPLRTEAEVIREKGKHLKLLMPRNHARVNQSSLDMLVSWRGNCDIQVLVYESDPKKPDIKEISRVTDYVVAYSCKGNTTRLEEIQTTKSLILNAETTIGGTSDLRRVCKQVMNRAATRRLISKQEASVMLADLPLTICSEYIETVSISNNKKLSLKKVNGSSRKKLIDAYAQREPKYLPLSLHQFFFVHREQILRKHAAIPHYVGVGGYPCFPISEGYARHVLVVYKPWSTYPNQKEWKRDFNIFINSPSCPRSARLTYDRVMQRYYMRTTFVDPKASVVDYSGNPISQEDEAALLLTGLGADSTSNFGQDLLDGIERGLDYQWDKPPMVRYSICPGHRRDPNYILTVLFFYSRQDPLFPVTKQSVQRVGYNQRSLSFGSMRIHLSRFRKRMMVRIMRLMIYIQIKSLLHS